MHCPTCSQFTKSSIEVEGKTIAVTLDLDDAEEIIARYRASGEQPRLYTHQMVIETLPVTIYTIITD